MNEFMIKLTINIPNKNELKAKQSKPIGYYSL